MRESAGGDPEGPSHAAEKLPDASQRQRHRPGAAAATAIVYRAGAGLAKPVEKSLSAPFGAEGRSFKIVALDWALVAGSLNAAATLTVWPIR